MAVRIQIIVSSFDPPDVVEPRDISVSILVFLAFFFVMIAFPLYVWFVRRRLQLHTMLPTMDIEMQANPELQAVHPIVREQIGQFSFESSSTLRYQEEMCVLCQIEFVHGTSIASLPSCGHSFHSACIGDYMLYAAHCPLCREFISFPDGDED
ncbi:RING-H2 finger protein [Melia azedarach]|uniref:RING-H2 finger protein n=1 Tax=Melia azedarach TaxID=155640 RepID=A0ACC1YY24_MELAZ|nr:RING-H2 finger protein [Melia azedarach]